MILLGIGGRERDDGGFGFVGCSQGVGGRAVVVVHRDAVGMGLLVFIWGGGGLSVAVAVVILDLLVVDVASGGYELIACSHGEEERERNRGRTKKKKI